MRTIFTIWTQPVKTFEYLETIEEKDLGIKINLLFFLGSLALVIPGIPGMVEKYHSMGNESLAYVIIMSLIAAGMGILFFKFVYSFLVWLIGKMLQGKASRFQVQLVLAYTFIPVLASLIISLLLIIVAIIGKDLAIIGHRNPFTMVVIMIFAVRTFIFGIAKYNRFSYGYALLNLCLVAAFFEGLGLVINYFIH